MEQLNTLDAGFLMAEDSDRHVSLAIGGIAIIEGAAPDYAQFKSVLAKRVRTIPRCTQVLRSQPFDVGPPKWVNDPDFDLARHVRRIAVPRPGDDAELFRVIARVLERRIDRDRPLWECWVIEGLKGDRWAILMKVHHCMADGISATRILTRLCDDIDGDAFAPVAATRRAATAQPRLRPVPDAPSQSGRQSVACRCCPDQHRDANTQRRRGDRCRLDQAGCRLVVGRPGHRDAALPCGAGSAGGR
jgi:WS/DGAT/MGAT family acyltransferase